MTCNRAARAYLHAMKRLSLVLTLALAASALGASALSACGAANVTEDPDRSLSPADRAIPPARTSLDETDGATAPRGGAQRPIGQGAGYEDDDEKSSGGENE